MSIDKSELIMMKAATNNDSALNGGRMSVNQAADAVLGNGFDVVSSAERVAGSTKYRKRFLKVNNDDDLSLQVARLMMLQNTPSGCVISVFPGTQVDTQGDLSGSEDQYGVGVLDSTATAGSSTLVVNVEDDSVARIFRDGDLVMVSDMTTDGTPDIVNGSGNKEFKTIDSVVFAGDQATITLTEPLDNTYATTGDGAYVASCVEVGTIEADFENFVVTAAGSGDYDDAGNPVLLDNIGTMRDTWTLTFTSATAFDCVGSNEGAVGSGNTSSDFSPINSALSKPYFTLESAGWSGSFQAGDTVVFDTNPAAAPIWLRRVVPAGIPAVSPDNWILAVTGASS